MRIDAPPRDAPPGTPYDDDARPVQRMHDDDFRPETLRRSRAASLFGHERVITQPEVLPPGELRQALQPGRHDPARVWASLPALDLDPKVAEAHHLIVTHRDDPVGLLYDHLRTRLLKALQERGWSRVGVAGVTKGCGASTLSANLALSLARRPSGRVLLLDMNLRDPGLARIFKEPNAGRLRDVLDGSQPMEAHIQRFGRTLAAGLNDHAEPDAAELLQEPATLEALEALITDLSPDVVIYDLPDVLGSDDVIAFAPELDGILLVADGTRTTAAQIRECDRLLTGLTANLGVVLNRAEDSPARKRGRRHG